MAADISEITESNQEIQMVMVECLRILRKIERELDEWRPVIEQYRGLAPAGMFMAARRARRNAIQEDGNGQVPHA